MKRVVTLAGFVALAIASAILAACGSDDDTETGATAAASSTATTVAEATAGSVTTAATTTDHNDADIAFAQGMIPHHTQAVAMAKLVVDSSSNAAVVDLAERIEAAQDPEIDTMEGWLAAWGADEAAGMHHGDDATPGMMSDADMDALESAQGAELDRMFLEMMIEHHQGAIEMANQEVANGQNTDAIALARAIISAQQAEITEMEALLAAS